MQPTLPWTPAAMALLLLVALPLRAYPPAGLTFACRADNDIYRAVAGSRPTPPVRKATAAAAIRAAARDTGVLVLADGYPAALTPITEADYGAASAKGLRLYVEFPALPPDQPAAPPRETVWERVVVASHAFAAGPARLRILALHGCRYVPLRADAPHLVAARVAGYDTAVYGLPPEAWPLLYEARGGRMLVAATGLSQCVRGRAAPSDAWSKVWRWVLDWLEPGGEDHAVTWTPPVRPTYTRTEPLPADAETRALRRGAAWFRRSRMLVHARWADAYERDAAALTDRTGPGPSRSWPSGDGSLGVLEGFSSSIAPDGSQLVRWWRRNDCNGEAAGALAIAGKALGAPAHRRVAGSIADWLYGRSILTHGKRADPANPAYGLIGWNDVPRYHGDMDGYGVYYADDQARSSLGMMLAAGTLRTDRWNERLSLCLLANLRVTGRKGFQPDRIDTAPLEANGWRAYHDSETVSYSPHYQGYMWACFLWAYRQSGYAPFKAAAESGIRLTMAAYPAQWHAAVNSLSLERARMLLPLAWLVRVQDTPEHRSWLRRVASDLLARQDETGAVREELAALGSPRPPASNEAYGTSETPLQQTDHDPAVDLLYTANFALLGLHEAAAATGEPLYRDAADRLTRFVCRAQVTSERRPELDGGWFRAFDAERWEFWASNADAGWGAWAMESGWSNTWMTAVLAMRKLGTSLWDATAVVDVRRDIQRLAPTMMPPRL